MPIEMEFPQEHGARPRRRLTRSNRTRTQSQPDRGTLQPSRPPPSSFQGLQYLPIDTSKHTKESTFKSSEITIVIRSPFVSGVAEGQQPNLPIFGDYDHVTGTVTLDPQCCAAQSSQLTISLEGVFEYLSPSPSPRTAHAQIAPGKHRHIFFEERTTIALQANSLPDRARGGLKSAIKGGLRKATSYERLPVLKRVPSFSRTPPPSPNESSPAGYPKPYGFDFALPLPEHHGDMLPHSFSSSNVISAGVRGKAYKESAAVKYYISAVWEAFDGSGTQYRLEAPVLFSPDQDFQSLDALASEPTSWFELPLSDVKELPFTCAITHPNPTMFHRSSSIPYFVVFTTTPRSRTLAAKVMSDATIAVSLVRTISFQPPQPHVITPGRHIRSNSLMSRPRAKSFHTSSSQIAASASASTTSLSSIDKIKSGSRFFKRVAKSTPAVIAAFRKSRIDPDSDGSPTTPEKPLPILPSPSIDETAQLGKVTESRTLHTDVSVGFPKRAKGRTPSPGSHPSLTAFNALPDGLYKGRIPLERSWFPTVQWKDLKIQYCLQISVVFDSHEFKAMVPVRLC